MPDEEVTIKIKADTSGYSEGLHKAEDANKEFEAQTKGVRDKMRKGWDLVSERIGLSAKKAGQSMAQSTGQASKGMSKALAGGAIVAALKIALKGAVAGLASMAVLAVTDAMGKSAMLFDPALVERQANKMNSAFAKVKTTIGAIISPLYTIATNILSGIANGINSALEGIVQVYGYIVGLVGATGAISRNATEWSEGMESATASANAGLAAFDKLTTLSTDGMGDEAQAQRIRDLMADAAESGEGLRGSIKGALPSLSQVSGFFSTFKPSAIWEEFTKAGQRAWAVVERALTTMGDKIGTVIGNIRDTLTSIPSKVASAFGSIWNGLTEGVKGVANAIIRTFNKVIGAYNSTIGSMSVSVLGHDIGFSKMSEIPMLASGGVAEPNDPFLAILGDNRRERELITPESTMREVMRSVLQEQGGMKQTIEIPISLDGRVLARASYDYFARESKRRGMTWV